MKLGLIKANIRETIHQINAENDFSSLNIYLRNKIVYQSF